MTNSFDLRESGVTLRRTLLLVLTTRQYYSMYNKKSKFRPYVYFINPVAATDVFIRLKHVFIFIVVLRTRKCLTSKDVTVVTGLTL
jgi:hypothetical protein